MARKSKPNPEDICLVPDCLEEATRRGLCLNCYQSAYRMQQAGEVTFDELVKKGLMLPKQKRRNKLADALNK